MSFQLTQSHLDTVLAPLRSGDILAFLDHMALDVDWRVGVSDEPGKGGTGRYTPATFKEFMLPTMGQAFEPGVFKHPCQTVDIIGNKAIIEDQVSAPMKNGQLFENKNCVILEFSGETGKISKMRSYLDTEVMNNAKRSLGMEVV